MTSRLLPLLAALSLIALGVTAPTASAFTWLRAQAFSVSDSDAKDPSISFGSDGSATIGWRWQPADLFASQPAGRWSTDLIFRPNGGYFGPNAQPSGRNLAAVAPLVLRNPNGSSELIFNSGGKIVSAALSAGGALTSPDHYLEISSASLWASDFAAATGSNGTTAVTWWEAIPDHHDLQYQSHNLDTEDYRLMASVRAPGGSFRTPFPVNSTVKDRLEFTRRPLRCTICSGDAVRRPGLSVHVGADGRVTIVHLGLISVLRPGQTDFVHDSEPGRSDFLDGTEPTNLEPDTSETFSRGDGAITAIADELSCPSTCNTFAAATELAAFSLTTFGDFVPQSRIHTILTNAATPAGIDASGAMAPDGTFAAVWRENRSFTQGSVSGRQMKIMLRVRRAGRSTLDLPIEVSNAHLVEPIADSSPKASNAVIRPRVAISADHTITVAWAGYDGHNMVIRATRIAAGALIPQATKLSDTGRQVTGELALSSSADGLTTIAAWGQEPATGADSALVTRIGGDAPRNLTPPTVTADSTHAAGNALKCNQGTWAAAASNLVQWLRAGTVVQTGGGYLMTSSDRGARITCRVIATNPVGNTVATSAEFSAPSLGAVAAGGHHTCGIARSGKVMCWGSNLAGQAKPPSTLASARSIDSGEEHSCAIGSSSRVACWGSNRDSLGSVVNQSRPPTTLGVARKVSAGAYHSCAIRASDSKVLCWGLNSARQAAVPSSLGAVTDVSAGAEHTCAISASGSLACWGLTSGRAPTGAPGPYVRVSAGRQDTCAVTEAGRVDCWGSLEATLGATPHSGIVADDIAVGDGAACATRRSASVICWGGNGGGTPSEPVTQVAASISFGNAHACAILADGSAECWGGANADGERTVPAAVSGATAVASGSAHTCAIATGAKAGAPGKVRCWGTNDFGQLDPPKTLTAPTSIFAGGKHTCAIGTDNRSSTAGSLFCWGASGSAQTSLPIGFTAFTAATGDSHTCAVALTGRLVSCWGLGAQGQTSVPGGLGQVSRLSAGFDFTCAIRTSDQRAACWGANSSSQTTVPAAAGTVKEISSGGFHTCAIRTNDTVTCWGSNDVGESSVPASLGAVKSIAVGQYHACAVTRTTGATVCWGRRNGGAITVPAAVAAGGTLAVAAGPFNTCAIRTSPAGSVFCWGNNDGGQSTVPSASFPGS